jgi:hypothetical protein
MHLQIEKGMTSNKPTTRHLITGCFDQQVEANWQLLDAIEEACVNRSNCAHETPVISSQSYTWSVI